MNVVSSVLLVIRPTAIAFARQKERISHEPDIRAVYTACYIELVGKSKCVFVFKQVAWNLTHIPPSLPSSLLAMYSFALECRSKRR